MRPTDSNVLIEESDIPSAQLQREARLMFALIDGADECGLLRGHACEPAWERVYARLLGHGDYDKEARALYDLGCQLERSGALRHSWIEPRWREVERRMLSGAESL